MAPWIVFTVVAAACFGAAVWSWSMGAEGYERVRRAPVGAGGAAWRLLRPLVAGSVVVAFLAGWALREPDPADEHIGGGMVVLAVLVGAVVLRSALRAVRSLRATAPTTAPIATVGLVRCRTLVSPAFRAACSPEVLEAALAHERAHALGRDPLRIWLAQLAADLQWPLPSARRRLHDWRLALEMRRDDEAVRAGARPTALAEGILLAARLGSRHGAGSGATATGDGRGLALRVRRLLGDDRGLARGGSAGSSTAPWLACAVVVAGAVWSGAAYGDLMLTYLPGIGR